MKEYQLIGLDQMEASIVRRRLHQWNDADEQAIMPLLASLQQQPCLARIEPKEPRWETNVYPLYYYWAYREKVPHKEVYKRVVESLPGASAPEMRTHVARVADTEIDILVEDVNYFVFIEAKIPGKNGKIKFEKTGGVHQLLRQYIQGKVLEGLIDKPFAALATIGANSGQPIKVKLNDREQALLRLAGEGNQELEIPDLDWSLLDATGQSDG